MLPNSSAPTYARIRALTELLYRRALKKKQHRREVPRLVKILFSMRGLRLYHSVADLHFRFISPKTLHKDRWNLRPTARVMWWMDKGHGVVEYATHGYKLRWDADDDFGQQVLDLVWGR